MKVWKQFLKRQETNASTPGPKCPISEKNSMRRQPKRGKESQQITSHCVMDNSDISSTCPTRRFNHQSGSMRHPFTRNPSLEVMIVPNL
jgi:hypothetical protein